MDNNELDEDGSAKKDRKDKSKFKSSSYKCQFCDKSFPRLGYLKKHEQVSAEIMILFLVIIIAAVPKLVQLLNIPMWAKARVHGQLVKDVIYLYVTTTNKLSIHSLSYFMSATHIAAVQPKSRLFW